MLNGGLARYGNVNPEVARYVLESGIASPTILDVGCWTGLLGKYLAETTDCVVDGVDKSEAALEKAKENGYRNCVRMDLSCALHPVEGTYDFMIYADVLEHTADPALVLDNFRGNLKRGGRIIISLPNTGFVLYRLTHLLGSWNYTVGGVMDCTHLRVFTVRSMRKFLESQGLKTVDSVGFNRVRKMFFFLKPLGRWWPGLFAMQVVFLCELS